MRTYKQCYDNLFDNILEPLTPDVFIHTWSLIGKSTKSENSVENKFIDLCDVQQKYNPKRIVVENFPKDASESFKGVAVPKSLKVVENQHYKGSIPMFYKMWACNELTHEENEKYDCVIKLRPDIEINEMIPEKVFGNLNKLWFSDYAISTNFQISDKFALGSPEVMNYYCSVWKNLHKYWETPIGETKRENRVGERLMYYHMGISEIETDSFSLDCEILRRG